MSATGLMTTSFELELGILRTAKLLKNNKHGLCTKIVYSQFTIGTCTRPPLYDPRSYDTGLLYRKSAHQSRVWGRWRWITGVLLIEVIIIDVSYRHAVAGAKRKHYRLYTCGTQPRSFQPSHKTFVSSYFFTSALKSVFSKMTICFLQNQDK